MVPSETEGPASPSRRRRSKRAEESVRAKKVKIDDVDGSGEVVAISCPDGYVYNHVESRCVSTETDIGRLLNKLWDEATNILRASGEGDDGADPTSGTILRTRKVIGRGRYAGVELDRKRVSRYVSKIPPVESEKFMPYLRRLFERKKLMMGPAPEENACESIRRPFDLETYQQVVALVTGPKSPVRRVLVKADTGAGKTCYAGPIIEAWKMKRPVFIVVPGDAQRENALQQLSSSCPGPLQKLAKEAGLVWSRGERDQSAIVSLFTRNRVFVLTYVQAANKTNGRNNSRARGEPAPGKRYFDESVIILDEVHYLANPALVHPSWRSSVEDLAPAIVRAKDSVVIGFSATPVVEDPLEIATLLNVFRGREVISRSEFRERFMVPAPEGGEEVTSDPERLAELERLFRGVVSVYENQRDTHRFPVMREAVVTDVPMGPDQLERLARSQAKDKSVFVNIAPASAAKAGARRVARSDEALGKVSPKFLRILTLLERLRRERAGKVIVFSQQKRTGADFLADALLSRGWVMGPPKESAQGEGRAFVFLGNYSGIEGERPMNQKEFTQRMAAFNSEENKRGERWSVAILTKDKATGINFQDVRHIVLVEAPSDMSLYHQVLGRARRFCSHSRLPRDEWTVDVHIFQSTLPEGSDPAAEREAGELQERAAELQREAGKLREDVRLVEGLIREQQAEAKGLGKAARRKKADEPYVLSKEEFSERRSRLAEIQRNIDELKGRLQVAENPEIRAAVEVMERELEVQKREFEPYVRVNVGHLREELRAKVSKLAAAKKEMAARLAKIEADVRVSTKRVRFIEEERLRVEKLRKLVRTDADAFAAAKSRDRATQSIYEFMRRVALDCEANKARTGVGTCLYSQLYGGEPQEEEGRTDSPVSVDPSETVRGDELVLAEEEEEEEEEERAEEKDTSKFPLYKITKHIKSMLETIGSYIRDMDG